MRFTAAQTALFISGIPFVHISPDYRRSRRAEEDFCKATGQSTAWQDRPSGGKFMLCKLQGEGCSHVPVLFIEDEADCEPRALAEALFIPTHLAGFGGPMVVR